MKEMTSLERVQAVLQGKTPDRVPVVPQTFLFAAKQNGHDIGELIRNPKRMAECHRNCQEKFGYDGCVIDFDDATLAEACGAKVLQDAGGAYFVDKRNPAINDLRDIDKLKLPDPASSGRLPIWMETAERLMEMVGDHVFVMGRADQGPLDLLALLRGEEELLMDLADEDVEDEVIFHALEWATEAHIIFAKAMRDITHATSMGDAYAGPSVMSPTMYRNYVLPFEKKVVAAVQTADKPYSVHICGDTNLILADMATTGAKIIEIDAKADIGKCRQLLDAAAERFGLERAVVMGNMDTTDLVIGSPEKNMANAKAIIEATKGQGLFLSSGCAMGANTNPDNVRAMVEAAKLYGSFDA